MIFLKLTPRRGEREGKDSGSHWVDQEEHWGFPFHAFVSQHKEERISQNSVILCLQSIGRQK